MENEIKNVKRVCKSLITHPMTDVYPPPSLRNAADKLYHSLPLPIFLVRCMIETATSVIVSAFSHILDGGIKESWSFGTTLCHSIAQAVMNHHPPQGRHSLNLVKFATSFTYPLLPGTAKIKETKLIINNADLLSMHLHHVAKSIKRNSYSVSHKCRNQTKSCDFISRNNSTCHSESERHIIGEWVDARVSKSNNNGPDRKIILYSHGGAHLFLSPRTHRGITSRLSAITGCKLFAVDYRLADTHPFPAAIEDVLAAYCALIGWKKHGFKACLVDNMIKPENAALSYYSPNDVVFAGDSSGGALSLQVMLVCRELGIPLPSGAILMSPLVDCECKAESYHRNRHSDILNLDDEGMKWAMKIYSGNYTIRNPLASPIYASLHGLPPILIQCGDSEVLMDEAIILFNNIREEGVRVRLEIYQDQFHVFQAFHFMEITKTAYGRCREFIKMLDGNDEWIDHQYLVVSPYGRVFEHSECEDDDDDENSEDEATLDDENEINNSDKILSRQEH